MTRGAAIACAAMLAACTQAKAPQPAMLGYGEARYVYVAAEEPGRIASVSIREGDVVAAGQSLFKMDAARLSLTADGARAETAAAAARVARSGALAQAVAEATAQARLADLTYTRSRALFDRGHIARARLDGDAAAAEAARAALARARAEQAAARLEMGALKSSSALVQKRIADLTITAPTTGVVDRIYRRQGEVVAAGEPMAALIAPDGMRVRFFAPQARLESLAPGTSVALSCDGCRAGLKGRVSYVAREPEFTPPVIYSREERGKLVFLIEAIPDDPTAIRPGLPVEVALEAEPAS